MAHLVMPAVLCRWLALSLKQMAIPDRCYCWDSLKQMAIPDRCYCWEARVENTSSRAAAATSVPRHPIDPCSPHAVGLG